MKHGVWIFIWLLTGCSGAGLMRPTHAPQVEPIAWSCDDGFIFDAYVDDRRAYLDIPGSPLDLEENEDGVYEDGEARLQVTGSSAVLYDGKLRECVIDEGILSLRRSGFTFIGEGKVPHDWQLRIFQHRQPLFIINGAIAYPKGTATLRDRKEGNTSVSTIDTINGRVRIYFTPGVCSVEGENLYPVVVRIETPAGSLEGCGRYL